jgi:hypothetical protein
MNSQEIDAQRAERHDATSGHSMAVRLLKDTTHGKAGQVVSISSSRGCDLIKRGDAEAIQ